jgi:dTMP kinase
VPTALPRGVLVAFEGIDGSGKTTQAGALFEWAQKQGLDVIRTKEPTAGVWGMKVRHSKVTGRLSPDEELRCFLEDRKEHIATLVGPALARGALVIIDRYYYSTVAYQGARGHDPKALLQANRAFAPKPDLVFLMDLDPKVGLARIDLRGGGQDAFETLPELSRARAIFLSLDEPHVIRLDAMQPPEMIQREVLRRALDGPLQSLVVA